MTINCLTIVKITIIDGTSTEESDREVPMMLKKRTMMMIVIYTPSLAFGLRSSLSLPEESSDWRDTTIFHNFTSGKCCKVIVDNGSCINALSSTVIDKIGLKAVTHLQPNMVSWIDATTQEVKSRCLVPIDFNA